MNTVTPVQTHMGNKKKNIYHWRLKKIEIKKKHQKNPSQKSKPHQPSRNKS